jgi:hypothetical protein
MHTRSRKLITAGLTSAGAIALTAERPAAQRDGSGRWLADGRSYRTMVNHIARIE